MMKFNQLKGEKEERKKANMNKMKWKNSFLTMNYCLKRIEERKN